jgi:hypothetical protein
MGVNLEKEVPTYELTTKHKVRVGMHSAYVRGMATPCSQLIVVAWHPLTFISSVSTKILFF